MKVCVVGGTGNISSSIVRLLGEVGHEVTLFNRGKSRSAPPGVKVIRGDRKERAAFETAVQAESFDAAIDMICYDAKDARSTLRAFRGIKHLVYCSTVCTYGVEYDWLPVTEDHPLRPITDYGRNKLAADRVFMAAHYEEGFPVTIIKPSTTFGPSWTMLRQIAWEGGWVDRVRKGKPIVVCGDGRALHQWLHVDDAAPAFVFPLGRDRCVGNTYNMMKREFGSWANYHRSAMKVIGHDVELVGVPLSSLVAAGVPNVAICENIFSHNTIYSPEKLMRDVPEFQPRISLQDGLARVLEAMERENRIPDSDLETWEDRLIAAQKAVGELKLGK
ncbi:NAD-dependent epimerase/dehydratase family protein [Verrucomicrobiota bacterium]